MSIIFNNIKYRFNLRKGIISANGTRYTGRKYTSQTEAIFTTAVLLGYTLPGESVKRLIDNFIRALIYAGVWDKLDYFAWFAYNDTTLLNFSRINWKRPFDAVMNSYGGCVYSIYGWKGNGVDAYIDTMFNPFTAGYKYTLNNAGRGAIVFEYGGAQGLLLSVIDGVYGANTNNLFNQTTNAHRINNGATTLSAIANLQDTGLMALNRDSNTSVRVSNKATAATVTATATEVYNSNQVLLRRNTNYGYPGLSAYYIGGSLTNTEVTALRQASNDLFTALSLTPLA